jgi:hypothetical protein
VKALTHSLADDGLGLLAVAVGGAGPVPARR